MATISVFDRESFLYIRLIFTPENKPCQYVVLEDKYAKQKAAYHLIHGDLSEVQGMIHYLQKNPNIPRIVQYSMYKAIIIQYAKCYTNADKRKVKLDSKAVFKSNKDLLEVHKEVMDMRHNYMAHAGEGKYEYGAMIAHLYPDTSNPMLIATNYAELKFMDHSRKLSGYSDLCKTALTYVILKNESLTSAFDKELESTGLKELYHKSKIAQRKDWIINLY